jgi:hypothetical protein
MGSRSRFNGLFDDHLRDSIAHGGHTEDPFDPTLVGNGDSAYRRWAQKTKAGWETEPVEDQPRG